MPVKPPSGRLWYGVIALVPMALAAALLSVPRSLFLVDASDVRRVAVAVLDPGEERAVRASLSAGHDATVTFTVRTLGTPAASHSAALDEVRRLFSALFHTPVLAPLTSVTLLGVVAAPAGSTADEILLLHAFMPGDAAMRVDWAALGPESLGHVTVVRWMPDARCRAWDVCQHRTPT
jgi:hypothetical protein